MRLTLGEISKIVGTVTLVRQDQHTNGGSIDSRTVKPGNIFFAMPGERTDGHEFVEAALAKGAAAAVICDRRLNSFPSLLQPKLIAVQDPLIAMQKIAAEVRLRWGGPVVAVTGSAGKTTTKRMIAALLGTRFRVVQNEGNLNNHIGLPLSLMCLERETDVGVFEFGMSAQEEIRALARIAAPDVAVVTNVGPVHLEFFPDVDAIARAKFELIEELHHQAFAVLNGDDRRVAKFGAGMEARTLYFGMGDKANFRAAQVTSKGESGEEFTLLVKPNPGVKPGEIWKGKRSVPSVLSVPTTNAVPSTDVRFHVPLMGRHNILNFLAAVAVCHIFGIPPNELQIAAKSLHAEPLRGEIVRTATGATIINDCYNSNPEALDAALTSVAALPAQRRIAVLGEMKELGPASESLHLRSGQRVSELGFDFLITVGEMARPLEEGARAAGMSAENLLHVDTPEEAGERMREMLRAGDVVLLKASRGVKLEKVWERLDTATASSGRESGKNAKLKT
ncbi:MAG: hypothetical protein A3F68_09400 [Acidobacteria bacterium RIFCSPLOWO2_12_FULL_54_10]|nr:MAG: hypothetical protein A3F68_09400 [Acidobacteria bacterium RIFCSPLOWO2_12_FULL_54_10]